MTQAAEQKVFRFPLRVLFGQIFPSHLEYLLPGPKIEGLIIKWTQFPTSKLKIRSESLFLVHVTEQLTYACEISAHV